MGKEQEGGARQWYGGREGETGVGAGWKTRGGQGKGRGRDPYGDGSSGLTGDGRPPLVGGGHF